ncbi:MAG: DUF934 domain-containing protein [Burkholderiaceae bacterium]
MNTWIDHQGIVAHSWWRYEGDAHGLAPDADVLLPVEAYAESRAVWHARTGRIGLVIGPTEDPQRIAPWLDQIDLIAVESARFTDGRIFSLGRLLRDRLHWERPLLAGGDLVIDQIPLLARCGFDLFELADRTRAQRALHLLANDPVHRLLAQSVGAHAPLPGSQTRRRIALL